ncbi:MAG: S8 family serine peptidase [Thermoanaerobaculia bacterium]|nr:S8 family serine peptidase [Thermoanaerobaculia bacterium]
MAKNFLVAATLSVTLLGFASPSEAERGKVFVPCAKPIEGRYLIALEPSELKSNSAAGPTAGPDLGQQVAALALMASARVTGVIDQVGQGFTAEMPAAQAELLARDRRVQQVEQACPVGLSTVPGVQQPASSWGLDRIDQRTGRDDAYTYYNDGTDVHVYVIDTGITNAGTEFGSRLKSGRNFVASPPDTNTADAWGSPGHGTLVASIIGGNQYGVARNVSLYPARIFPSATPETTTDRVVNAVNWVVTNMNALHPGKPTLVNMSFFVAVLPGSSLGMMMSTAISSAITQGVVFVAAANNHNQEACNFMPSGMTSIVTVGGTDINDQRWVASSTSGSNFGLCVDLFAPAKDTLAITKTGVVGSVGGTSSAAPHVTGAAALYLQSHPAITASARQATVASWLVANATSGVVGNPGAGSPNKFLFAKEHDACFTWSCNQTTRVCSFSASCSLLPSGTIYYSWDMGDGTTYYGGAYSSFSHTYGTASNYQVKLTLLPWLHPADKTKAVCVKAGGPVLTGCVGSGTAP